MSAVYYQTFQGRLKPQEEHKAALHLLETAVKQSHPGILMGSSLPEMAAGSHGKPYFKDFPHIHFNISHCPGMIACIVAHQPVGIDAEAVRAFPPNLVKRVLTPSEQDILNAADDNKSQNTCFFRFWTLKESWIKQTGTGLSVPLTGISFNFLETEEKEKVRILSSEPDLYFFQWLIGGHILAVCSPLDEQPVITQINQ